VTVAYSINGGSEIYGVTSAWERRRRRSKVDNQVIFTNMAVNVWRIPIVDMTTFETLRATQGNALTSLETNNPEARNSAAQFTTVIMGLVQGTHDNIRMADVTIEFDVDLNSEV
jgi:hypothetical protein